jgi:hypothetical protein
MGEELLGGLHGARLVDCTSCWDNRIGGSLKRRSVMGDAD